MQNPKRVLQNEDMAMPAVAASETPIKLQVKRRIFAIATLVRGGFIVDGVGVELQFEVFHKPIFGSKAIDVFGGGVVPQS